MRAEWGSPTDAPVGAVPQGAPLRGDAGAAAVRQGAGHGSRRGPRDRAVPAGCEDGTSLVLGGRDAAGLKQLESQLGDRVDGGQPRGRLHRPWRRFPQSFWLASITPTSTWLIAGAGLDRAQSLLAFDWRQAPRTTSRSTHPRQPGAALQARAGDGKAWARPRDRDRQPRRPSSACPGGRLPTAAARRPWPRSASRHVPSWSTPRMISTSPAGVPGMSRTTPSVAGARRSRRRAHRLP